MIGIKDIHKLLSPLKNRLFLMIGRGIIQAVTTTAKTPLIQVVALDGEIITDAQFLAPYGFEAIPSVGEALFVAQNGNRKSSIMILLHNRDERPTDVEKDEVQMWSKYDNYIKCNKSGEIELNGKDDYAVAYDDLKKAFDELKDDFNDFINLTYNIHKHPTAAPGAPSLPDVTGTQSTADMSQAKVDKVKLP